jgi:hypothetical protein
VKPEPSFYIGYRKTTPADLARFNRAVAASLALAVVLGVALIASLQGGFGMGQFEFGNVRAFEGVLYQQPAPALRVATRAGPTYALLVGPGKFGIPEAMRGIDGKKIRFDGTLIHRQGMTMIEVTRPETVEVLGEPGAGEARGATERIGPVTVAGEIVDTKCYLGAMRPSHGKVHRACAIRCLSGGVPAAVLVRDAWGRDAVWVLTSADGGKLDFDIEWTARPVRISGELEMQETLPVLRVQSMELLIADQQG